MDKKDKKDNFAITPRGLKLMIAGVLVMAAGFILMMGGGVKDPQIFNYDMFDFRRLVLAPLVIIGGVVLVAVSIMRRGKKKQQ